MPHDSKPAHQLRLLLSWRDALLEGSTAGKDCVKELQRVERALVFCCARHRQRLENLGVSLRLALQDGKQNSEAVTLRGQVEFYNSLLRAQNADELGGRIEIPLERYVEELDALGLSWRGGPKMIMFRPLAYLSPSDRKILLALPFCLILSVISVFYFMRWRGEVCFELLQGEGIHVLCTNNSSQDILLYAPWPEQYRTEDKLPHYGLELYLKEKENDEYRPYPSFGKGWYYQGSATSTIEPIRVSPGLAVEVELRPKEIPILNEMAGFRVEAQRENGRSIAQFDFRKNGS